MGRGLVARPRRRAGGLRTSRLECRLSAPAALGRSAEVSVANRFRDDRIGRRELAAAGSGIALTGSTLLAASVSAELRAYPKDLLSSRSATFTAASGAGSATAASAPPPASGSRAYAVSGPLAGAERWLENAVGGSRCCWRWCWARATRRCPGTARR
ncbi:hypothetical protein [Actinoplanes sp. NPDC026623]|uniref:hypothetical protein n=1 Tax=Actinoplanes sp. NPDC026623 TaxID=3155610 RepID=UPI00340B4015